MIAVKKKCVFIILKGKTSLWCHWLRCSFGGVKVKTFNDAYLKKNVVLISVIFSIGSGSLNNSENSSRRDLIAEE